jgi:hypothetical protein
MSEKITITELVQIAAKEAAETAINMYEKQRKVDKENRYHKRIHNTLLLLQNYRVLRQHVKESVCEIKKSKSNALEILDELDFENFDDNVYVESIKHSTQKTIIILEHVAKMLEVFKNISFNSGRKEDISKYEVIYYLYIDENKKWGIEKIADSIPCSIPTLYSYRNNAISVLSGLIFGLDGTVKNNSYRKKV